jgi:hypothetical protein
VSSNTRLSKLEELFTLGKPPPSLLVHDLLSGSGVGLRMPSEGRSGSWAREVFEEYKPSKDGIDPNNPKVLDILYCSRSI